jgi:hypothetical protein
LNMWSAEWNSSKHKVGFFQLALGCITFTVIPFYLFITPK